MWVFHIGERGSWLTTLQVGWMCNYLRHVTAQFLIEHLDLSWKDGFLAQLVAESEQWWLEFPKSWQFWQFAWGA